MQPFLTKILITTYLFVGALVYSQPISFLSVTTNDGLSQNSVTSISQDSFGFLWIATQDGLNRYDGSNFKRYNAYFEDVTEESFSRLGKVFVDHQNQVWAITSDGVISMLNEPSDTFISIDTIEQASVIAQKEMNQYWVGSYTDGLYTLDKAEGSWRTTSIISNIAVYQIFKEEGSLLLATDNGIYRYYMEHKKYESVYKDLEGLHISKIIRRPDGSYFISTFNNGLFRSRGEGLIEQVKDLSENLRVQDILEDKSGEIWVATYSDGVYVLNDEEIHHFVHKPPSKNDINYNDVLTIYKDQQDNIWLGTDGGGLSFYQSKKKPINNVTNRDVPPEMSVDVCRAISTDQDGNIWVGTSGKGLTSYHPVTKKAFHFATDLEGQFNLTTDRIVSLLHDRQDKLWIGTQEGGLLSYDPDSHVAKIVSEQLPAKTIWHISEKDESQIWLCSRNNGLILFNTKKKTWQQYRTPELQSLRVMIRGQANGTYFIGTDEGKLLFFNEVTGKFKELSFQLETGSIKSLFLENDELWIGSQKEGIVIYNLRDGSIKTVSTDNGLPNKVVYAILNQNDQFLWISTNKGICQIDKNALKTGDQFVVNQVLNFQNGLASNEFNTGAYHQDKDGIIYFGGIEGVSWFDPYFILKNKRPTSIILLELITSENGIESVIRLHDKKEAKLNYKNRSFQIKYSDLTYAHKESINFQYRLNDFNAEWINNGHSRSVSFSNVPPGSYNFELRANNDDGIWNEIPVDFKLVIVPAFWQTSWFKFLILSLLTLGMWYLINLRIKNIKRTADLKQNIAQSESKALRAQMSPHFIFNSLNAIDNFILNHDAQTASDYLSKFSKLMRQILDYSNLSEISLAQEIEILSLYVKMEQMRFPAKFDYHLKIDPSIDMEQIKVPPLVFQPYAENAIWHGLMHIDYQGSLMLVIEKNNGHLMCRISDNGIGRSRAKVIKTKSATKRKSQGMQITQERINLLSQLKGRGGNVTVKDGFDFGSGSGTTVIITFPA